MSDSTPRFPLGPAVGIVMLALGIAVFAIRLQHAGPYAPPEGGNLGAALGALLVGGWLVGPWAARPALTNGPAALTLAALVAAPILLFFGLYATLAEVEEVVSIDAVDRDGRPVALRLWIVDREDGSWILMPRSKAEAHGLQDTWVDMLRGGERLCMQSTLRDDPATVGDIVERRYEKYAVHRLATAIGLFEREAGEHTVALHLEPCPPN